MIHAQTLNNAKLLISKLHIDPNQYVSTYILDEICEKVKKANENGNSSAVVRITKGCFSKATLQIIALYGYKLEFCDDPYNQGTYIYWNKL